MSRRGRPPHPDILTPREWEVLALLREGLSDEAIAERLGLSIHGAKYHVREILSKLGVSSRQDAAAWQPEERVPARRWLALPLTLRVAGALVVVAAVGGLGLLAWGVARTSDEAGGEQGLDLPTPGGAPQLNTNVALLRAAKYIRGDIRKVEGGATTWAAAKAAAGDTGTVLGEPRSDAVTWFFRFSGVLTPPATMSPGPANPDATPVRPLCMGIAVWFRDLAGERVEQDSVASGLPADCSGSTPVSQELAVVLAAEDKYWASERPPLVQATRTTYGDARQTLASELHGFGAPTDSEPTADTPVWLVSLTGEFFGPEGEIPEGGTTPRPTTVISCLRRDTLIDAEDACHPCSVRAAIQLLRLTVPSSHFPFPCPSVHYRHAHPRRGHRRDVY